MPTCEWEKEMESDSEGEKERSERTKSSFVLIIFHFDLILWLKSHCSNQTPDCNARVESNLKATRQDEQTEWENETIVEHCIEMPSECIISLWIMIDMNIVWQRHLTESIWNESNYELRFVDAIAQVLIYYITNWHNKIIVHFIHFITVDLEMC